MRGRTRALLGGALLAAALASPAAAQEPTIETVVTGLATPRGLTIAPDGTLYVAEAGSAGDQCMGEGAAQMCFGPTGGVSRIVDGTAERVVDGLPSGGSSLETGGLSDVVVNDDGSFVLVVNSGGDPAERAAMGPEVAAVSGWLLRASPDGTFEPWVDVAAYETTNNPEPTLVDANPYSIARVDGGIAVADAGMNALLLVAEDGTISTLAVFPPTEHLFPAEVLAAMGPPPEGEGGPAADAEGEGAAASPAPAVSAAPAASAAAPAGSGAPAAGEMIPLPVEAVPTSVVVGPDGALYVGQLTGGPFPIGGASVWRVPAEGGEPEEYATGFTTIIDIAFGPDGTLYVAEITHEGLMSVFGAGAAPIGAVLSVPPGGGEPTLIVSNERVMAPGGIVVDADGAIWVSTNTLPAGADGQLVKITL